MDVLALIASCSLYGDTDFVHAIIRVHSRGLPNFVADTSGRHMPTYALSQSAGKAALATLTTSAARPVIGLLSVPSIWATTVGEAPESLFDGCLNIRIGSAQLAHFARACKDESPASAAEDLRPCIAGLYGEAIGLPELPEAVAASLRYWRAVKVARRTAKTASDSEDAADLFLELSDVAVGE
ncbi:hypothetical protein FJV41_23815 [Myxococcus llanfairpwllgwyngyllgogerychwyrndrobwllllantysiliogogogochensis]|uniref:Uncharacterized protein n=1 Tax=Myxococcus llanfairpwllgwyngyllgogerychwyrndrobwllllantysiliogogogochensis TaxID=2590453 RepID=A0A540WWV3_9BACT|nr:hypothetical protein [Myxococcus llanfairpwllgwyngyllgogerychwyrndrobwllllantysiliogogogochensis]TQF13420.1 hypothetical protein FJV41_23815 [Myxococcus llanfairpwllgwyngyllgogerychwyrndrobwllllantysiliogogogochensis]